MTDIEFGVGRVEASCSKAYKCLKRVFDFKNLFTTHYSQFTKAIAFTLAETLIVMGIIGVVAALTLPNLNSSTGDREKVAKVKKIYQNLNDAFGRAEAVYGPYGTWFINDGDDAKKKAKRVGERMTEFMKISKNCEQDTDTGCLTKGKSKHLDGTDSTDYSADNTYYKVITADGMSIAFSSDFVYVDIDGPNKGSYTKGKDLFRFDITDYKGSNESVYPYLFSQEYTSTRVKNNLCKCGYLGARWIIDFGNMDYLKALKDPGKCDNNTSIVLDGVSNTTCK